MSGYNVNVRTRIRSRLDDLEGRQIIQGNFNQISCDELLVNNITGSNGYFNQIISSNTNVDNINLTGNLDITGSINIYGNINQTGGYYNYNDVPIDNSFYPNISSASSIKALSAFSNRTITLNQPSLNSIEWSPKLSLFASIGQQGLEGRLITSPNAVDWTVRNNYVVFINNVTCISLTNCNNGVGNIITCTSTAGLATGTNLRTSGSVTTTDPFVTQIIDGVSFITSSLIPGLLNTTLLTNCFTCTNNTGLIIGMSVSGYSGGPGALSGRSCIAIPSSTQFILSNNRSWTNVSCTADKAYQGMIWCDNLNGIGYFIAGATNAESDNQQILTSTDGITWTRRNTPIGYSVIGNFAYSPSLRRVVGLAASNGYIYSDDGINWNAVSRPDPLFSAFYAIEWSPELNIFVAAANGGTTTKGVQTSPDGINWTSRTAPVIGGSNAMSWSPELGIFCVVGGTTPVKNVMISKDGINWDNNYSTPVNLGYRAMSWSPQLRLFVAVSNNRYTYSFDGKTWTMGTTPTGSGFKALTYSPELGFFVAAGNGSSLTSVSDAVATTTLKGLPPTSFNVFDSSFNNISELGLWSFQSFGRGVPVTKTADFSVQPGENWIIVNRSATTTVTLPTASLWTGRELMFKTVQNQLVISNANDVVQLDGSGPSNSILPNIAGRWVTLVSNGTNWEIQDSS
jgi:hypothetical protein